MPLRVLNWNIGDGVWGLENVAARIRAEAPDVVLLNEIMSRGNQTRWLADATEMPHHTYRGNAPRGPFESEGVAILSRHPLRDSIHHPVTGVFGPIPPTKYGSVQTTMDYDGLAHLVFSTRFAPQHPPGDPDYDHRNRPDNMTGHDQLRAKMRAIDSSIPIILGGDFNAKWHDGWPLTFRDESGLFDSAVTATTMPSDVDVAGAIDRIFYRRHYYCASFRNVDAPEASDHGYQCAELVRWDGSGSTLVPRVVGLSQTDATRVLEAAGYRVLAHGSLRPDATVLTQHPPAVTAAYPGSGVAIRMRGPSVTVPDVVQMYLRTAREMLKDVGLNSRANGPTGIGAWVRSQSPQGGYALEVGSTVGLTTSDDPIP